MSHRRLVQYLATGVDEAESNTCHCRAYANTYLATFTPVTGTKTVSFSVQPVKAYRFRQPFEATVLRVHLFTRSAIEHIQLLAMHHIAGDMWSFDILLSEL